jgi:regulator of protease activity HflC (stomatin/prohibitin superfamily)
MLPLVKQRGRPFNKPKEEVMIGIGWSIAIMVLTVILVVAWLAFKRKTDKSIDDKSMEVLFKWGSVGGFVLTGVLFVLACLVTIEPGHSGVSRLFGDVRATPVKPGLHFANPFLDWTYFDCREKTFRAVAQVPSRDQLMTKFEVSVQYRIVPKMTPRILNQTGTAADMVRVHLVPKLRSLMREMGKTVIRAEDFYQRDTQERLQKGLLAALRTYLTPLGMNIKAALIRDIQLPASIRKGVEKKKQRDQKADRELAELRRFKIEQKKKVAKATAQLEAAKKDAQRKKVFEIGKAVARLEAAKRDAQSRRVLADARAYEITKVNRALQNSRAYIQLQSLKTLQKMSTDKATKIYFMNGQSKNPLPLLHLGKP